MIKDIDEFSVNCADDACVGDEVLFTEVVWSAGHKERFRLGSRRVAAIITASGHGTKTKQHTMSLRVTGSDGYLPLTPGGMYRRMARNVYRNGAKCKIRSA